MQIQGIKASKILLLLLLFSWISCTKKETKEVNTKYSKTVNGVRYTLKSINDTGSYALRIENTKSQNIGFLKGISSTQEDYNKFIHYYAYEMLYDIYIVCNDEMKVCNDYFFERTYDITNFITLTFSVAQNCNEILVIEDKVVNTGLLKFKLQDN